MAAQEAPAEPQPERGVLSVRMSGEQRAALEYLKELFPTKYSGLGSVLNDYSLTEAVETHRRAQQLSGQAAS